MKREFKGLRLWILNNALIIAVIDSLYSLSKEIAPEGVLGFAIFGVLWLFSGVAIVGSYVDADKVKKIKKFEDLSPLSYSFIDNSILLSTQTIQKNGFQEVWRQENKEHSIQILCFNNETKQFQAFDRFHWMDEPEDIPFVGLYGVYKEDMWTPIELHYTTEWLNFMLTETKCLIFD